jgi:hypothetical protein
MSLDRQYRWDRWSGGYESAREFLVDGHAKALSRLREALNAEAADELTAMIGELCHPLVEERGAKQFGRPLNASSTMLARYITRLDLIAKRVTVRRHAAERS